ncbi:MAG TPA: polyphosphate kinase 2 family protein, partial [Ignavibacteriaceae bacterium]|nr:polyphosphate kinase 2 family protein [Ignavibacteriaceae bacterium]
EDPAKHWKFSADDINERKYWNEYHKAYEDAINATSKDFAPWYIIPADKKWFTRLVVSEIIVETLEKLKLEYPKPSDDWVTELNKSREILLKEKE